MNRMIKGILLISFTLSILAILITFVMDRNSNDLPPIAEHGKKLQAGPDQRPSDWHWMRRTAPYFQADADYYRQQIEVARQMRRNALNNRLESVQFAGPTNIGGRISDVEFNPQNPNIVYAAAATGGLFKSTNMGVNWFPIIDDAANLNGGDIGIDPVHPNTVYFGTGEPNGGHNNFPGGGLYKTTDGGTNWQFIGLENTVSIGRIVVDPSNTQRVFVAAVGSYFATNPERGIYRSEDGGQTWTRSLFISDSTGAIDIVIDPNNPNRLMAAMWERVRRPNSSHLFGPTSGIYRSTNSGSSWEYLGPANGLPNPASTNIGRIGLAIAQTNPELVYAVYTDGSYYAGLFRTTDFGTSWTNADPDFEVSNGVGGFSWYFGQVRIHPTNPDMLFVLDVSFMRSTNAGSDWPLIYGYGGSPQNFHVDHHALAFNPTNPDYLIEGNDGGINISTDAGVSWTKVAELPVTQFYEIGLDATNPQRLYGGTQDNGTMRTLTGALNDWDRIYGGDGFYVIVDPTNPNVIYAESQNGDLGKSVNGGSSWSGATSGIFGRTNWSTPVVMDPNNNQVLYYGAEQVFRTTNGAGSWTAISPDLTPIPAARLNTITTIGVAPTNSNVIWAGTDASNVWVSTDYGANWSDVSASLPERWVTRVIPDPTNENIAYVTFSGIKWKDPQPHVFRTTDQGLTWTDISSNLPDAPVNAFAMDPYRPNVLFVGTDLGAYFSTNTGTSWQYLSNNLPMVSVYDMKIHDTGYYLALGTHARSMYKFDLNLITGIKPGEITNTLNSFRLNQNYPNPFNPTTTISFNLSRPCEVSLKIFNLLGEEVATLLSASLLSGFQSVEWDGRDNNGNQVASGTYIYQLISPEFTKSRQMVFLK